MVTSSSPQHLAVGEVHNVQKNAPNEIKKQSYASTILAKQSAPANIEQFPVVVNQGEPVIQFTKDEVNNFIKEEGLHQAVVIKFSYGRPELSEVRRNFSSQFDVQGHCNIGHLEYRHLLVRFDLHNDYVKFLSKSTAYLKSKRDEYFFRTFPWSLEFNPKEETPMAVVWISLPGLPPNIFAKRSLMSIASAVGKPLAVDKATHDRSRPSAARVKVIINLLENHPKKIKLQIFDRITGKTVEFYQQIVIDNLPKYCTYCKHQGHEIKVCRIKKENCVAEVLTEAQLDCDKAGQEVVELDRLKGDARDYLNAKRAAQSVKDTQGKVVNAGVDLTKISVQIDQTAEGKNVNNEVAQKVVNTQSGLAVKDSNEFSVLEINPKAVHVQSIESSVLENTNAFHVESQDKNKQIGDVDHCCNVPMQSLSPDVQNGEILSDPNGLNCANAVIEMQVNEGKKPVNTSNPNAVHGDSNESNVLEINPKAVHGQSIESNEVVQKVVNTQSGLAVKDSNEFSVLKINPNAVHVQSIESSVLENTNALHVESQDMTKQIGNVDHCCNVPMQSMSPAVQNGAIFSDTNDLKCAKADIEMQVNEGKKLVITSNPNAVHDHCCNEPMQSLSPAVQNDEIFSDPNGLKCANAVIEMQVNEGKKPVINSKECDHSKLKSSAAAVNKEVQHEGNTVSLKVLKKADFESSITQSTHEQGTVSGVKNDMALQNSIRLGDLDEARLISVIKSGQNGQHRSCKMQQMGSQSCDSDINWEGTNPTSKLRDDHAQLSTEPVHVVNKNGIVHVTKQTPTVSSSQEGQLLYHCSKQQQGNPPTSYSHTQASSNSIQERVTTTADQYDSTMTKKAAAATVLKQSKQDAEENTALILSSKSSAMFAGGKIQTVKSYPIIPYNYIEQKDHEVFSIFNGQNKPSVLANRKELVIKSKLWDQRRCDDEEGWEEGSNGFSSSEDDQEDDDDNSLADLFSQEKNATVSSRLLNHNAPAYNPKLQIMGESSTAGIKSVEQNSEQKQIIPISAMQISSEQGQIHNGKEAMLTFEEGEEEEMLMQCRKDAARKGDLSPMHSKTNKKGLFWDGRVTEEGNIRRPPMRIAKLKQLSQRNNN